MGELLGELGHHHLITALVVPVRLLDVGKQGVSHDLPQGEAHNVPVHQQHAPRHVVELVVVQHLVGLAQILVEGGGRLVPPGGVPVQEGLHRRDVLLCDHPEGPVAVGFQELVHMVALAAELLASEVLQILRPVQVVKGIPVGDGGAVGKKLLEAVQLVLGHRVEGDGHAPAAAVVGDLPVVLPAAAPQGQGKGAPQSGVLHLEVEGAVVDGPLRLVHIPPHHHRAGGGVTDPASAVPEIIAELGQVF